ncbi:hypothetical protein RJ641_004274 [Dillenia turbinata]|uniref:Uncharacterized protein n=1 Tax=Dillenia turbinata TaxID=194707 RepID=A0AAN8ZCS7_9MAGN
MIKMEGLVGGGGGIVDDMGEGMQCSDHPYRNNPGGICAFCLQEKLGKLVSSSSSSFPISIPLHFPPSSSSSSPSFRSDFGGVSQSHGDANGNRSISSSSSNHNTNTTAGNSHITSGNKKITNGGGGGGGGGSKGGHGHYHEFSSRRARIPFLLTPKKKKKKGVVDSNSTTPNVNANLTLKRNQSTRTPRRGHFMDDDDDGDDEYEYSSPHRRWFWSFLYHSKSTTTTTTTTKRSTTTTTTTTETIASAQKANIKTGLESKADLVVVDESESPSNAASFGRKVSRSRSVGCGSRSFSGDFFERISTGFGDCGTLRRVESHREGKPKVGSTTAAAAAAMHCKSDHHHQYIKERVKCGGIFGGFMMTSSSSSSSSSSYWVSSAEEINGGKSAVGPLVQGRSKSWGWAFASPIRAFSRTSSKIDGKLNVTTHSASNNSTTTAPNLTAIPSLLTARS